MHQVRISAVLDYWFLPPQDPRHGRPRAMWFGGGKAIDFEIQRRFAADVERALAGAYDHWAASARGALALCLLLDQFTRHIFRGTGRAFAGDRRALAVARKAVARGFDRRLPVHIRTFFYLPFEHSEALGDQHRCIGLMSRCLPASSVRWAVDHRNLIARFGRFPHRNAALGRPCRPDEQAYLDRPHQRYGQ